MSLFGEKINEPFRLENSLYLIKLRLKYIFKKLQAQRILKIVLLI